MSAKRRGLGRGLDALLGSEPAQAASDSPTAAGIATMPIDRLEPNRFQPRAVFDETGLEELAESIRTQGIVQPLVITPKKDGGYTIIAGERRWRAAKRAGLTDVPVVVREVTDDQQLLEMALVENIQRADLNAMEEAEAYRTLSDAFGLSQEDIATRVGKGRTTITNTLRLLRLPDEIQDLVREGQLTAGQARPLLSLPGRDHQIATAKRAILEGLTARELEALAAEPKAVARPRQAQPEPDVHTRAAAEEMTRALQTKVEITRRKRGGRIEIHFHSEEELIRLYDRLMGKL